MRMLAVESSNVEAVGYDPASSALRVRFKGGAEYEYAAVPPELVVEVLFAPSVGAALNNGVKAKGYECRKVEGGKG